MMQAPAPLQENPMATLNVNGQVRTHDAEPDTPLLWVLREQLGLTGTKYGCGIAQCGACTVHIDGVPSRSCVRPVSSIGAAEQITTIEGLSPDGQHPLQKAWVQLDVPQCGFCQSGMLMTAAALMKTKPRPSAQEVREAMTNICRCGTYNRVQAAIQLASAAAKG
jgi:isoquinoline 1-oxidoreductase alpha subunit